MLPSWLSVSLPPLHRGTYVYHMVRCCKPTISQLAVEARKGRMGFTVRVVLAESYGP